MATSSQNTDTVALGGARSFFSGLSTQRRILIGTLVCLFFIAISYVGYLGNTEDYAVLFAGLKVEDAAEITKKLDEQKVPYVLEGGGTIIKVPIEQQDPTRLMLASEGMPRGGTVGFELFDNPRFGMTAFEQRMNYRRALQGELRRTIRSLDEVDDVNIHIVLPKKGTFREDDQDATASIVLNLGSGRTLKHDRVNGVVNLVATAVEGLDPEHVTVLDQQGRLLSSPSDPVMAGTMPSIDLRRRVESDLEKRINTLLEPAVGINKARVHVTVAMDFRKVEQRDERFDPKSAVIRSENSKEERGKEVRDVARGVPGARANAPGAANPGNNAETDNLLTSEKTLNYEINRTTRVVEEPVGKITTLNVAVLVDGNYSGVGEERAYIPRTEEELKQIDAIVKTAVGFDAERGDQVVVRNMPFVQSEAMFPVDDSGFVMGPDLWRFVRYGVIILLALMILLFLVRPLVKALAAGSLFDVDQDLNAANEEIVASSDPNKSLEAAEEEQLVNAPSNRLLAIEYAATDPRKTAQVLRAWLLEDDVSDDDGDQNVSEAAQTPPAV